MSEEIRAIIVQDNDAEQDQSLQQELPPFGVPAQQHDVGDRLHEHRSAERLEKRSPASRDGDAADDRRCDTVRGVVALNEERAGAVERPQLDPRDCDTETCERARADDHPCRRYTGGASGGSILAH
jgi:hypothetical protein